MYIGMRYTNQSTGVFGIATLDLLGLQLKHFCHPMCCRLSVDGRICVAPSGDMRGPVLLGMWSKNGFTTLKLTVGSC